MYVTIRAYQGNTELADALAAREDELRGVIGGIDGFQAYYLLKLTRARRRSACSTRNRRERVERGAAAWLKENLPDMPAAPYVTAGEAVVSFTRPLRELLGRDAPA